LKPTNILSNTTQAATLLLYFLSTIGYRFVTDGLGIDFGRPVLFGGFIISACFSILIKHAINRADISFSAIHVVFVLMAAIVWVINLSREVPLEDLGLVYGLIGAVMLSFVDLKVLRYGLIFIIAIQFAMLSYEVLTKKYIYTIITRGVILDEVQLGGTAGVFRAKGLFEGPLTAASFTVFASFWLTMHPLLLGLLVASAVVIAGRGPIMFFGIYISLLFFLSRGFREVYRKKMLITLMVCFAALAASTFVDPLALERLATVFTLDTSADAARLRYWQLGIDLFAYGYESLEIFFGSPKRSYVEFGNSSESAIIQMLLDYGIFGFVFLLSVLMYCLLSSHVVLEHKLFFMSVVLVLASAPVISTAGISALFFLAFFWAIRR
jgi:hypothetical protein